MKTTYLIATALFLSSIASAQQADIRSKTAASTTVSGSQSGTAAKGSIQNSTEVRTDADPKPSVQSEGLEKKSNATVVVSAGQDNKNSSGTSIKTSNNASKSVSVNEPVAIKKSVHSAVNQTAATSQNVAVEADQNIRAKSEATVSASRSATKSAQVKARKSARVKANSEASANTYIRPIPVRTSSMISTGASLGL
jgi:hypothetical protein